VRVEIWSDVVCPFCYIGKRRFETALANFEHRDDVDVVLRSFELDPDAPTEPTEKVPTALARKYGISTEQALANMAGVDQMAAGEGLVFNQADAPHANTRDAHRLLHLALAEGGQSAQAALNERLLQNYFVDAQNPADHALLRESAIAAGLDPARVDQVLSTDEFDDDVEADVARARAYGATGVPFFVVDQRYGIAGAQPTEAFSRTLEAAWNDRG
jgi:predicted DsbA family dithiol-disulfide isomerase